MKPTRPPPPTETGRTDTDATDNGRNRQRTTGHGGKDGHKRSDQEKTYVKNAYVFFQENFLCQIFEGGISPSGEAWGSFKMMVPPHAINSKICTTNPLKSAHLSLQKNPLFIRGGGLLPRISNKYPLAYKPL